ncbi:hypothetical protein [Nocardia sp. NPDC050175]|uniref:hypothetical protein n=1 Tax=Nocardia sp. NPDC050175 TaxID=3364317 RepID=UPI00378E2B41
MTLDDATKERFGELAEVLSACREAFLRITDDHHWEPAPGSVAAQDITEYTRMGIRDPRIVLMTVCCGLQDGANNCGGMCGLFVTGEAIGTVEQLTRSVLEGCAYAAWTIGDNPPAQDPKGRLARTYIQHRWSTVKAKEDAQRLGGKESAPFLAAAETFKAVRAELDAAFPLTTGKDLDHPITVSGQTAVGLTAAVQWFMELVGRYGGGGLDRTVTEGLYGFLSNSTHPTLYTILQRLRPVAHTGHWGSAQEVDIEHFERLTKFAVGTMYNALAWVYHYAGWEFDVDSEFAAVIERVLPDFFRAETANERPTENGEE